MKNLIQTSAVSETEFVTLNYPGAGFLINRQEILMSHYGGTGNTSGGTSHPVTSMEFNHKTIPLISLDNHLLTHYGELPAQGSGIILCIRGSGENPPFPRMRRKNDSDDMDTSILAVKTSAAASIETIHLEELKPLPVRLRALLGRLGLIAVRFPPGTSRPQYLLDIRTISILSVIRYHNRHNTQKKQTGRKNHERSDS